MPLIIKRDRRPPVYPEWLAERCVYLWFLFGWSWASVADKYDLDFRTVKKWCRRLEDGKQFLTPQGRKGQSVYNNAKLTQVHYAFLILLVKERPDTYLDEFQDAIWEKFGITVHLATVCRTLQKLGYTRKVLQKRAKESMKIQRAAFREIAALQDVDSLWFMDESAVDDRTSNRTRGRAQKGERTTGSKAWLRNQRYSVLPFAHATRGVVDYLMCEGGVTTEVLRIFTDRIVIPNILPGDVIVLDNASIHNTTMFREAVHAAGGRLLYTPPYTPKYQPCELLFSKIKLYLQRYEKLCKIEDPCVMMDAAMQNIGPDDMLNWLNHCWGKFWEP